MRIDDLLDLNRLINVISHKYTISLISLVYLIGMFLWPIIAKPEWEYLQSVWDRWQSLNVGVLALISSVVVFKSTKYHSEQTRERQYKAARSMLPDALSELDSYCFKAVKSLRELWEDCTLLAAVATEKDYEIKYPRVPPKVMTAFRECISFADTETGDYLANILSNLQVFDSRLSEMCEKCKGKYRQSPLPYNVKVNIILLSGIHALKDGFYDEARGIGEFKPEALTLDQYIQSFALLNLDVGRDYDEFDDLLEMTEKAINSKSGVFGQL